MHHRSTTAAQSLPAAQAFSAAQAARLRLVCSGSDRHCLLQATPRGPLIACMPKLMHMGMWLHMTLGPTRMLLLVGWVGWGPGKVGASGSTASTHAAQRQQYCAVGMPQGFTWGQGLQDQKVEGRQGLGAYPLAGAYPPVGAYQPAAGAQGRPEVWHAAAGHMHAPPDLPMDCMNGAWLNGEPWTPACIDSPESASGALM